MATPNLGVGVFSFPTDVAEFDRDERISFSRLDSKYIAVQDDGTEFEFDEGLKRWIPLADDGDGNGDGGSGAVDFAEAAYQDVMADARPDRSRKRKQNDPFYSENQDQNGRRGGSGSKKAKAQPSAPRQPRQNTAVYVTGLPPDATVDEVAELFSRKCGVIAEEIDSGRPRIKMYTDADGRFKGDALVVFFKPQSVEMAIMLLDDTEFRFDPSPAAAAAEGDRRRMRVQAADASYKKTNYQGEATTAPAGEVGAGSGSGSGSRQPGSGGGEAGATAASSAAPVPGGGAKRGGAGAAFQDKQKIIKKTQKLDAKLADWSSDEDERFFPPGSRSGDSRADVGKRSARWDRVVVLKHMFTLDELDADPAALLDIKEDIREECAKLGDVTNVVLFDEEPAGVVSVKFKTAEAAAACVRLMGGRAFDGRIVEASLATGREKFRKSKKGGGDDNDEDKDSSDEDGA